MSGQGASLFLSRSQVLTRQRDEMLDFAEETLGQCQQALQAVRQHCPLPEPGTLFELSVQLRLEANALDRVRAEMAAAGAG